MTSFRGNDAFYKNTGPPRASFAVYFEHHADLHRTQFDADSDKVVSAIAPDLL
jgi:hypothetical protein